MTKRFFKWLWELIKSFGTVKGLISLLISFIIWYGWVALIIHLDNNKKEK